MLLVGQNMKPMLSFKRALANVLKEGLMEEGLSESECQIADFQFCFNNSKMLKLLEERGDALKDADFKTAE